MKKLNFQRLIIPDIILIYPALYQDERGWFQEVFRKDVYHSAGIDKEFVQDNVSCSSGNVLRGLHYQLKYPQAKLVYVLEGEIFDVVVDIRKNSKTFGKGFGEILSDVDRKQMYIPEGFAHGFVVLTNCAVVGYKCTEIYHPEDQHGIIWNDPAIGIQWLETKVKLSEKDSVLPLLKDIPPEKLF